MPSLLLPLRCNEIGKALENYDEDELLKFKFLVYQGYSERDIVESGLDSYAVEIYNSRSDSSFKSVYELLAMQFVEEGLYGEIPESLENYIDYEKITRDLEFEDSIIGKLL